MVIHGHPRMIMDHRGLLALLIMNGKIDRDSGVPPWRQVYADLRRRIAAREWTSRLPSQVDLAYEYGVNFKLSYQEGARRAAR